MCKILSQEIAAQMRMITTEQIHIGKDRNFKAALFSLKGHSRRKYAA